MASAQRRISDKRRIYEGEQQAEMLVNWLNHADDEEGKGRIQQVIALYSELWVLCRSKEAAEWQRSGNKWVSNKSPELDKRHKLETSLNQALDYYQTRPSICFADRIVMRAAHGEGAPVLAPRTSYGKGNLVVAPFFSSNPVAGSAFAQGMEAWRKTHPVPKLTGNREPAAPGSEMAEVGAIRYTLALLESGFIFKIHRCRCEEFFFQRFSHQRFCSEKCRIAEFRTSDESRQKRNAYARKLYQLHKTKNVK